MEYEKKRTRTIRYLQIQKKKKEQNWNRRETEIFQDKE
jgi:hypothetical protein